MGAPALPPSAELGAELGCEGAVNFYKHHIGDYAKKTAHLTVLEHGAYLLMLHAYYGTEKPLPAGETLYRMLRAQTQAERAAVDSVAAQFWTKTESGLVNGRAFDEIKTATHLVDIAKSNGTRGGRPKKPSGLPGNNPAGLITEPTGKAIQTPLSSKNSVDEASTAQGDDPADPRKQLFDIGKTILGSNAGAMISKAISAAGESRVGAILGEMALRPTADPRAYFAAAVKAKGEGSRFKTA